MADITQLHVTQSSPGRLKRRAFAVRAHAIEGNPLDAADLALLDQFDRDGLTTDERIAAVIREARTSTPK